jgi:hypothetical protein
MRHPILCLSSGILLFLSPLAGCNCNGTGPNPGSDGGGSDGGKGQDGGRPGDGGPGNCLAPGAQCGPGSECCNGTCSSGGICTRLCEAPGAACSTGLECCTSRCDFGPDGGGICSALQCQDVGQSCAANTDCCTLTCTAGGTCGALTGQTCSVIGQTCQVDGGTNGCCSTDCQNETCAHQWSCQADNDICQRDAQCCSQHCTVNDGGAGLCQAVHGSGSGSCTSDGNPCPTAGVDNYCCSHICEDLGTGTTICVPAEGCSVAGDPCNSTLQCCGNTQGATCETTCTNVQACNAPGNICGAPHLPDGGYVTLGTARVDCCPGGGIMKEPCFYDPAGVPRCFGQCPPNSPTCDAGCPSIDPFVPGCCLSPGETCNSAGECCNFLPCVPNDAGVLTCTLQSCLPIGALCQPDAGTGCCNGTGCLPAGEVDFACQLPGTTCFPNTTACDAGAQCCSAICTSGVCQKPAACQPEGAVCTLSGDCCSGLSCIGGTCEAGGTCGQAGQSCSAIDGGSGSTCCAGLGCLNPVSLNPCNGTAACNCEIVVQ